MLRSAVRRLEWRLRPGRLVREWREFLIAVDGMYQQRDPDYVPPTAEELERQVRAGVATGKSPGDALAEELVRLAKADS